MASFAAIRALPPRSHPYYTLGNTLGNDPSQPPSRFLVVAKLSDGLFPSPVTCAGCKVAPAPTTPGLSLVFVGRSLSGDLRSVSYPPRSRLLSASLLFSLPLHTRLFGPHTKWKRVGNGHALMFMMTSLPLSSPCKPCILTILVLASEVGIDFMIIVRTVWAKDPFILNGCFCN